MGATGGMLEPSEVSLHWESQMPRRAIWLLCVFALTLLSVPCAALAKAQPDYSGLAFEAKLLAEPRIKVTEKLEELSSAAEVDRVAIRTGEPVSLRVRLTKGGTGQAWDMPRLSPHDSSLVIRITRPSGEVVEHDGVSHHTSMSWSGHDALRPGDSRTFDCYLFGMPIGRDSAAYEKRKRDPYIFSAPGEYHIEVRYAYGPLAERDGKRIENRPTLSVTGLTVIVTEPAIEGWDSLVKAGILDDGRGIYELAGATTDGLVEISPLVVAAERPWLNRWVDDVRMATMERLRERDAIEQAPIVSMDLKLESWFLQKPRAVVIAAHSGLPATTALKVRIGEPVSIRVKLTNMADVPSDPTDQPHVHGTRLRFKVTRPDATVVEVSGESRGEDGRGVPRMMWAPPQPMPPGAEYFLETYLFDYEEMSGRQRFDRYIFEATGVYRIDVAYLAGHPQKHFGWKAGRVKEPPPIIHAEPLWVEVVEPPIEGWEVHQRNGIQGALKAYGAWAHRP